MTASKADAALPIQVAGETIEAGQVRRLEIPVARLPTGTWLSVPVCVINGTRPGARMWLSAAIHGDEINGVEIIRRVLEKVHATRLKGVLIAVPIVNVFGFIDQSRYLPDRRDLNRCFPGSPRGSLASRLANLFMTEIVQRCTHGIDIHTAAQSRTNLPQIRANLLDADTRLCAKAFGAPVMVHANSRDGSIREAAARHGISVLVYEAGEPLRFNEPAIRTGVEGILRVMATLGMQKHVRTKKPAASIEAVRSRWIRSRQSGILRVGVALAQWVRKHDPLGVVSDAFGERGDTIRAPHDGLIIGRTNNPLVNQGDAIVHLAETTPPWGET